MKKVLWVSQHRPLKAQIRGLKKLFGQDVVIDIHDKPYSSASEVMSIYKGGKYDEMVLIAPLSVCKTLCSYGVKPLYSEMEQVIKESNLVDLVVNNTRERIAGVKRYYHFVKFKRMERVEIIFSELDT